MPGFFPTVTILEPSRAGVAELVDAAGLGPAGPRGPWRFESSRPHFASRAPDLRRFPAIGRFVARDVQTAQYEYGDEGIGNPVPRRASRPFGRAAGAVGGLLPRTRLAAVPDAQGSRGLDCG